MNSTSSGFLAMFEGQRCLLTNAHSVDYHTQVCVFGSVYVCVCVCVCVFGSVYVCVCV